MEQDFELAAPRDRPEASATGPLGGICDRWPDGCGQHRPRAARQL